MEWVIAAVVVVLLGLAALVAVGRFGAMRDVADRDVFAQPLPDRPLHGQDLESIRFGVTLRGYAMNQVDDLLDRLALELARRDHELEQLRRELDLPVDADPFAKYQLDGGQGVPTSGDWYDGDRRPTPVASPTSPIAVGATAPADGTGQPVDPGDPVPAADRTGPSDPSEPSTQEKP